MSSSYLSGRCWNSSSTFSSQQVINCCPILQVAKLVLPSHLSALLESSRIPAMFSSTHSETPYQDRLSPVVLVRIVILHWPQLSLQGVLITPILEGFSQDLWCNKDNLQSCSSVLAVVWRRIMNRQAGMDAALNTQVAISLVLSSIDSMEIKFLKCLLCMTWPGCRSDCTRRSFSSSVRAISWLS